MKDFLLRAGTVVRIPNLKMWHVFSADYVKQIHLNTRMLHVQNDYFIQPIITVFCGVVVS